MLRPGARAPDDEDASAVGAGAQGAARPASVRLVLALRRRRTALGPRADSGLLDAGGCSGCAGASVLKEEPDHFGGGVRAGGVGVGASGAAAVPRVAAAMDDQ